MDLKITQSDVHGAAQESEMDSLKYTLTKKFVNLLDYQSTILTQVSCKMILTLLINPQVL